MAQFEASALLDVSIDEGSLRSARRTIESELGGVNVQSPRPTGARTDGGGAGRGSTTAMIAIQKKTLDAQRDSADFDEERNEILLDILDTLEGRPTGGRGGGRGLPIGGAGLLAGGLSGGPFAALGLTTGLLTLLASQTDAGDDRDPTGRGRIETPDERTFTVGGPGRRIQLSESGARFFDELGGDPFGRFTPQRPDRAPRQGGTVNNNVNVQVSATANVDAPSDSLTEPEVRRFAQAAAQNEAQKLADRLRAELTGDTTTGGAGGLGGGLLRT